MENEATTKRNEGDETMTDKYEIAAKVTIADQDGFVGTMAAKLQRELFGCYAFGRKTISIDASGQGSVSGHYSCCYGTDSAFFNKSFDQIARFSNDPLSPWGF